MTTTATESKPKRKTKAGTAAVTAGKYSVSGKCATTKHEVDRKGYPSGEIAMQAATTFANALHRMNREATYYVRDENGDVFGRVERLMTGHIYVIRGDGPTPVPSLRREEPHFTMPELSKTAKKSKTPGPKEQQIREQREARAAASGSKGTVEPEPADVGESTESPEQADKAKSTEPVERTGDVVGFEFAGDGGPMRVVGWSTTAGYVEVVNTESGEPSLRKADQIVAAMAKQGITATVKQPAKKRQPVAPVQDVTGDTQPRGSKTNLALEGAIEVLREHKGPMKSQEMFAAMLAKPAYAGVNTGTVIVMLSKELRAAKPRVKRIVKGTYEAA